MKIMLASDLRKHESEKLLKIVSELKHEHMNLRFQKSGAKLEKTSSLCIISRNIARVKTILREKMMENN